MHACYIRGDLRDEIPLVGFARDEKRFLASSNSLCSPTFEHNTDQSPVSHSIAYCEYVRPIFQLNVGPDKSNDTRFFYNQDDFGSWISKIAFAKL